MSDSQFVVRTKIRFHRVAHPEVVAFLEALAPGEMATVLSALVVRGVMDVTGRTRAHFPDQTHAFAAKAVEASAALPLVHARNQTVQASPVLAPPPPYPVATAADPSPAPTGPSGHEETLTAADTSRRLSERFGLADLGVDPFDYSS